jgi:hypothetical protein
MADRDKSMSNEGRLKEILHRQNAAVEEKRRRAEEALRQAAEADQLKIKVAAEWRPKRQHLEGFIRRVNVEMKPNGVQLYIQARHQSDKGEKSEKGDPLVDRVEIAFDEYRRAGSHKVLMINVHANGLINVRMGTSSDMPARQYDMNIFEMAAHEVEIPVIDFLDLNT